MVPLGAGCVVRLGQSSRVAAEGGVFVLVVLFGHMIHTRHKGTGAREPKKRCALFPFSFVSFPLFSFSRGWMDQLGVGLWLWFWWRNEEKLDGRKEVVEEVNT